MKNQSGSRELSSSRDSFDLNTAMTMVNTYRERALRAEFELREMKRSLLKWIPVKANLEVNRTIRDLSTITVTLSRECCTEHAVDILEKLGFDQMKLDLSVN